MAGLIPLALNPECAMGKRYSATLSRHDFSTRRTYTRPSSDMPPPQRRPAPKAPLTLYSLPATPAEWKAALSDIKRAFLNNKFRQCSDRCHEILNHCNALDKAQPAHVVYLRFYAATALEMQARASPHSSHARASLFQQAQAHYRVAVELAQQADEAVSRPPSRRDNSPMPSYHSSADSDTSRSSNSTRMSSPAPSISSIEDDLKASAPACNPKKKKKRVAFCDVPVMEPIIRPDSPTLGFDDWLGRSSPEPIYPEPILKYTRNMPAGADMLPPPTPPDLFREGEEPHAADPFFHARSIHQYTTILSGIRRQIKSHMDMLDAEIASCQDPAPALLTSDELRTLDVRARIERLRANGWQRRRFDAQRYQTLRENALADLGE